MLDSKERYRYLVNARNYHYTQFNIWMAFFIAINGSLFIAYYSLLEKAVYFEKTLVLFLGYIAAFLFYCSSKGYYYWIINFITLINEHEKRHIKCAYNRVYSCFADKKESSCINPTKGANISTSKLVCLFAYILTFCWGILLILHICTPIEQLCLNIPKLCGFSLLCLKFIIFIIGLVIIFLANLFFAMLAEKILQSNLDFHTDLKLRSKKT